MLHLAYLLKDIVFGNFYVKCVTKNWKLAYLKIKIKRLKVRLFFIKNKIKKYKQKAKNKK